MFKYKAVFKFRHIDDTWPDSFLKDSQKLPPGTRFHTNRLNIKETDQNGPKKGLSSRFFSNLIKFLKSAPKITPMYQISFKSAKY